jgi:hypothetical protein
VQLAATHQIDFDQMAVDRVLNIFASYGGNGHLSNLAKTQQLSAEHQTDFDPPIYNIWRQQTKSPGSNHYGNSEARWRSVRRDTFSISAASV